MSVCRHDEEAVALDAEELLALAERSVVAQAVRPEMLMQLQKMRHTLPTSSAHVMV